MFNWFWDFLYTIFSGIAGLIDFLLDVFRILSGMQKLEINGEDVDLLTYLLSGNTVSAAFWLVVLICAALLFLGAILAIIKMQYDNESNKTPGKIVGSTLKAFLTFFLIPIVMVLMPMFVNTVAVEVDHATNPYYSSDAGAASSYQGTSIGGQILITIGEEAWNSDYTDAEKTAIRNGFLNRADGFSYLKISDVRKYYNIKELNFILSYIAAFMFLFVFASTMLSVVERIINIVILYIMAPFPIAASVLDDGARFKLWREQILIKFLSVYGVLIALNIYMILAPIIQGLTFNVAFFGSTSASTIAFTDGLIKMLFLVGSAIAVKKAPTLIGNLISQGAGSQEAADRAHSNQAFSRMAGMAMMPAGKMMSAAGSLGQKGLSHTLGKPMKDKATRDAIRNQQKAKAQVAAKNAKKEDKTIQKASDKAQHKADSGRQKIERAQQRQEKAQQRESDKLRQKDVRAYQNSILSEHRARRKDKK